MRISDWSSDVCSSDLLEKTIESLVSPDTFTVTTGHQLNIFGGPLYFIYKIIATINLAEAVEKVNLRKRIVPVFWLATEDHDFEEINHTYIFGKELKWARGNNGPAGRMDLARMDGVLDQLKGILGTSPEAAKIVSLFGGVDWGYKKLAAASPQFVRRWVGENGLLSWGEDRTTSR